eukprot:SAG31_NODE_3826_length_3846_cov_4.431697_1_plen_113_part_10
MKATVERGAGELGEATAVATSAQCTAHLLEMAGEGKCGAEARIARPRDPGETGLQRFFSPPEPCRRSLHRQPSNGERGGLQIEAMHCRPATVSDEGARARNESATSAHSAVNC